MKRDDRNSSNYGVGIREKRPPLRLSSDLFTAGKGQSTPEGFVEKNMPAVGEGIPVQVARSLAELLGEAALVIIRQGVHVRR